MADPTSFPGPVMKITTHEEAAPSLVSIQELRRMTLLDHIMKVSKPFVTKCLKDVSEVPGKWVLTALDNNGTMFITIRYEAEVTDDIK